PWASRPLLQSKLVKYFSRQLSCKRKVALQERNAKLEGFPQLLHWFRIVDIRKEVMEEIAPGQLSLEELLEMTDDQVCETVEKFGANSEECARLNASLSCLRSVHKSGGSLSKQDWTIQWPTPETGKENNPVCQPEPVPWLRTHLAPSPKVPAKCGQHYCHAGSAHGPIYTHVDRLTVEGHPGLCLPVESGHRSLPPSPRQRHALHTPPRTPNIVTTMTPPGTPPVRRRNKLKPPGTPPPSSRKLIHLLPGFTALHRSKSHEFQLGHRVDEAHTPKKHERRRAPAGVLHARSPQTRGCGAETSRRRLGGSVGNGLFFGPHLPANTRGTEAGVQALPWARRGSSSGAAAGTRLLRGRGHLSSLALAVATAALGRGGRCKMPFSQQGCKSSSVWPESRTEGLVLLLLFVSLKKKKKRSSSKQMLTLCSREVETGKAGAVAFLHAAQLRVLWPLGGPAQPRLPWFCEQQRSLPVASGGWAKLLGARQQGWSLHKVKQLSQGRSVPRVPHPFAFLAGAESIVESIRCPLGSSAPFVSPQNEEGNEEAQESEDDFEEMNLSLLSARNFPRKASQTSIFLQEWDIPFEQLEIGELIGKGRFGQVFHGRWHGEVAIRLIDIERDNEDQLKAFKREFPVTVSVFINWCCFSAGVSKPLFFSSPFSCSSSLCKGRTLYSVVRDAKIVLDVNKTRQIAQEIVKGMGYLHAKGILHKDLKSKNVFYDNGKVVITDFGLFSISGVLQAGRRENKLRIQNGWLCHLAPEIIRQLSPDTEEDKLPFSKHSDVFALGTIWYELHAREWPFKTQPAEAIIWQVGRGMKPNLSQIGMGKEISDILLFCWAYEQEERPTFTKLMDMLEKLPKRNRRLSHPGHFWKSAE
ncbi:KSR2 Kinase, partial [Casuarius casuarius]|nr:KSR2 Kinase [Casuarius casuarius]